MRRLLAAILLLLPSMAVAQGSFAVPTYTAGSLGSSATVATPSFSPGGGSYSSTQTVTISTATSLAVLCYTTDGSTPTESGHLCSGGTTSTYSTPISVATTQTVKAIGTKATYTDSAVGSAAYTISASHAMAVVGTPWLCGANSVSFINHVTCSGTATTTGDSLIVGCTETVAISSTTPSSVALMAAAASNGSYVNANMFAGLISNATAGTTSVTFTNGSSNYLTATCEVVEVSGLVLTSAQDVSPIGITNTGSYGTGSATNRTGAITTSNSNDVIIGFVATSSGTVTFTAGTGYTLIPKGTYSGGSLDFAFEYMNTSAAGTYNPGMTWSPIGYYTPGTAALKLQ